MSRISSIRSGSFLLGLITSAALAPAAYGTVYVTGSVSASTSNVPLQTYESQAASGAVAVDLGRYIRLGLTHKQEFQISSGYTDTSTNSGSTTTTPNYVEVYSRTHIVSNSLDLTLILYEGQVFLPYLTIGGIVKNYRFETQQEGEDSKVRKGNMPPVPNVGAGVGIRLNKDFTLKFSYTASPGLTQKPGDEKPKGIWDKSTSIGLTYQL
jgi:hypothetical protein